jgi:hypothetical protein
MPGSPQGGSPLGTLAGDAAVVDGGRYGKGVRFDGDGDAVVIFVHPSSIG